MVGLSRISRVEETRNMMKNKQPWGGAGVADEELKSSCFAVF